MNASNQCTATAAKRQPLSCSDKNHVMGGALQLMIQKTNCTDADLVEALETILKTLPAVYLKRIITVALKRLDSL